MLLHAALHDLRKGRIYGEAVVPAPLSSAAIDTQLLQTPQHAPRPHEEWPFQLGADWQEAMCKERGDEVLAEVD
eukprot:CAMPEP_0180518586 /NCGR_PEP_ID=MMETSP1036_2-20121128/55182_1 /TAXON_ID=632150 /ORGANISM="Azadinium spinosum, Strain 3D9" /LENGTH=73 /DNA_ID=CAMNT_0022530765 /DNA_START=565 /DNA_END=786 /DNA_ORIENTATION=+